MASGSPVSLLFLKGMGRWLLPLFLSIRPCKHDRRLWGGGGTFQRTFKGLSERDGFTRFTNAVPQTQRAVPQGRFFSTTYIYTYREEINWLTRSFVKMANCLEGPTILSCMGDGPKSDPSEPRERSETCSELSDDVRDCKLHITQTKDCI